MRNNAYEKLKDRYAQEVRERWGDTDAFRMSEERGTDLSKAVPLLDAIMEDFAALHRGGVSPNSESARIRVERLQQCITDNFYTCTDEILEGWDRCMLPTSASRIISTRTAKAQRSTSPNVSKHIVE